MRNPDDVNPDWVRPDDWPWPDDFGSVNWKKRMQEAEQKALAYREKYGFIYCPVCKEGHTCKTTYCRGCGYKLPPPAPDPQ